MAIPFRSLISRIRHWWDWRLTCEDRTVWKRIILHDLSKKINICTQSQYKIDINLLSIFEKIAFLEIENILAQWNLFIIDTSSLYKDYTTAIHFIFALVAVKAASPFSLMQHLCGYRLLYLRPKQNLKIT